MQCDLMGQWAAAAVISLHRADYCSSIKKALLSFFWCARTTRAKNSSASPSKITRKNISKIKSKVSCWKGFNSRVCLLHYWYCSSVLWRKGYFWECLVSASMHAPILKLRSPPHLFIWSSFLGFFYDGMMWFGWTVLLSCFKHYHIIVFWLVL